MRRIRILTKHQTPQDVAGLVKLAAAIGYADDEIDIIDAVGTPLAGCDDEIILIPLSATACSAQDLEDDVKKAPNGGRRAICVWPEITEGEVEPPPWARKYAYSVVCWDADKLKAAAADDDVLCFELPSGAPIPKVYTERNMCVDEEKKPK